MTGQSDVWCTGYQWGDIEECVNWMSVYARVLKCQDRVELKMFSRVAAEDAHNIQTHTVSLDLLVGARCHLLIVD
jgi:G1/S-specific cyclin-E1